MKYRILARFIRACLLFGVLLLSLSILLNVYGEIFNAKKYLRVGDTTFGDTTPGYPMHMGLQVSIPDTIITFKSGTSGGRISRFNQSLYNQLFPYNSSDVKDKIIQKLVVSDTRYKISAYNPIRLDNAVQVNVDTKHKAYRIFWTVQSTIKTLSLIFIFIFIIKLINIYLQGEFLNKKSFRLISYVGLLLIFTEVFEFVCIFINARIIPGIHLETSGMVDAYMTGNIQIGLNFVNSVNYSNIGIGIMVVILSKVIKDAVAIKLENDLTI